MEIPEPMVRWYKSVAQVRDELGVDESFVPNVIANFIRDTLARALKAEFWTKHAPWKPACGPVTRDGVMSPCPEPQHDWTDTDWQAEAHKQLMGEVP